MLSRSVWVLGLSLLFSFSLQAASPSDRDPETVLYSKPVQITAKVWSAIGATQYYTYENGGA